MVSVTTFRAGKSPADPENATTSFSSGGGLSNIYQPSYQKDAVTTSVNYPFSLNYKGLSTDLLQVLC